MTFNVTTNASIGKRRSFWSKILWIDYKQSTGSGWWLQLYCRWNLFLEKSLTEFLGQCFVLLALPFSATPISIPSAAQHVCHPATFQFSILQRLMNNTMRFLDWLFYLLHVYRCMRDVDLSNRSWFMTGLTRGFNWSALYDHTCCKASVVSLKCEKKVFK